MTHKLPDSPTMPIILRRLKFAFQPVEYIDDFSKAFGDAFTIWGSRDNPIIYFSHPKALEAIFTADLGQFDSGRGNRVLEFMVGSNSLILLDGDRHSSQRKLLAPPFHGDRMRTYGEIIQEITQNVSHKWQLHKPFKIRESMQEITLRVILRVVFGLDRGARLETLQQLIASFLELLGSPILSASFSFPFLRKDFGGLSPWVRMQNLQQQIDELIYDLIAQRRTESDQNREDILSLMMSARYDDGEAMSDVELHDELMTLLVAGHETTASALTWAFYWVDYLPQVREKLLAELNTVGTDPNVIAKLPYLTAVCQETLRIYPIVMTGFARIAKFPVEIMGYQIPQNGIIVPNIYSAHHREEVYPQSKQFQPERFLERQFSPYEYLPFGGGNRRCIGMAFAMYEMKLVLATILSQYQVSRLSQRPVKPVRRGLTVATPGGMKMVVKSR